MGTPLSLLHEEVSGYFADIRLKENRAVDHCAIAAELPCWHRDLPDKSPRGQQRRESEALTTCSLFLLLICTIITNKEYFTVLMPNHGTGPRSYEGTHDARH